MNAPSSVNLSFSLFLQRRFYQCISSVLFQQYRKRARSKSRNWNSHPRVKGCVKWRFRCRSRRCQLQIQGWERVRDFPIEQHWALANQRHFARKTWYRRHFSTRFCKNVVVSKQVKNTVAVLAFLDQWKGSVTNNKNNWATYTANKE